MSQSTNDQGNPAQASTKEPPATRSQVEISSMKGSRLSSAGDYVQLDFEDVNGRELSWTLTASCVQQLIMTLPHLLSGALARRHGSSAVRAVFPLGEWRLEVAGQWNTLLLTLMTRDGFEVCFSLNTETIAQMTSSIEKHRWIVHRDVDRAV
jgi:hypothetical protein